MDGVDKFEYPNVRPTETFHSSLRLKGILDETYEHASNVYAKFKCSKCLDYHMLYLKHDALLLADVFEHFRKHQYHIVNYTPLLIVQLHHMHGMRCLNKHVQHYI